MNQDEVREWLRQQLPPPPASPPPNGDNPLHGLTHCTMCGNNVSSELRGLNSGMARGLRAQYEAVPDLSVVRAARIWKPFSIECSQLAWWGFIYPDPQARKGYWGMTPRGAAWVRGDISVPKYAELIWDRHLGKRTFRGLLEDNSQRGRARVHFRDVVPYDHGDHMGGRSAH